MPGCGFGSAVAVVVALARLWLQLWLGLGYSFGSALATALVIALATALATALARAMALGAWALVSPVRFGPAPSWARGTRNLGAAAGVCRGRGRLGSVMPTVSAFFFAHVPSLAGYRSHLVEARAWKEGLFSDGFVCPDRIGHWSIRTVVAFQDSPCHHPPSTLPARER